MRRHRRRPLTNSTSSSVRWSDPELAAVPSTAASQPLSECRPAAHGSVSMTTTPSVSASTGRLTSSRAKRSATNHKPNNKPEQPSTVVEATTNPTKATKTKRQKAKTKLFPLTTRIQTKKETTNSNENKRVATSSNAKSRIAPPSKSVFSPPSSSGSISSSGCLTPLRIPSPSPSPNPDRPALSSPSKRPAHAKMASSSKHPKRRRSKKSSASSLSSLSSNSSVQIVSESIADPDQGEDEEVIVLEPTLHESMRSSQDHIQYELESLLSDSSSATISSAVASASSLVRALVNADHDVKLWLRSADKLSPIIHALALRPVTRVQLCAALVVITSNPKNIMALDQQAVVAAVSLLNDTVDMSVDQSPEPNTAVSSKRRRRRKQSPIKPDDAKEQSKAVLNYTSLWKDIDLPQPLQLAKHCPSIIVSHALAIASFETLFTHLIVESRCLDKLCESVQRDVKALSDVSGSDIQCCHLTAFRLGRCMVVLENIAQSEVARQSILVDAKPSPLRSAVRLSRFAVDHDLLRSEPPAYESLLASLRLLTNVSNQNKAACSDIAAMDGPAIVLRILEAEIKSLETADFRDQDLIIYSIGVLINCVEAHDLIREQLLHHELSDVTANTSSLLVNLLFELVKSWDSNNPSVPCSKISSRIGSEDSRRESISSENSGWDELQSRMICGYVALLLGVLCLESPMNTKLLCREIDTRIRLQTWINVLERFAEFSEKLHPDHDLVAEIRRVHAHLSALDAQEYQLK